MFSICRENKKITKIVKLGYGLNDEPSRRFLLRKTAQRSLRQHRESQEEAIIKQHNIKSHQQ